MSDAFIRYRIPGGEKQHLTGHLVHYTGDEINQDGFIIAPFDSSQKWWFLDATQTGKNSSSIPTYTEKPYTVSKEHYLELCSKFVQNCKEHLQKAILSRVKEVSLPPSFKSEALFESLCLEYPDAFVYWIKTPVHGEWIGATPETLVERQGRNYKTMALAGTQAKSEEYNWGEKEIKEQEFVTNYLVQELDYLLIDPQLSETYTKEAGQVAHLCTDVEFNTHLSLSRILHQLHPTPAVCGVPKQKAFDFIQQEERHQRELYSGFLGPISTNSANIFVNLRCMKIIDRKAYLYIGGGITSQSDPEKEWLETEMKGETLFRVIEKL